jgi:hypothetical protein
MPQSVEPFIRAVQLRRRIGGDRLAWFVIIGGNPMHVYRHLFANKAIAPGMLWLPRPLGVQQEDWDAFTAPDGPLGLLFRPGAPQPRFVVAPNYLPGWQQTILFQRCHMSAPGFDLMVASLPGVQTSPAAANFQPGGRSVKISRTPIHPAKLADDELVVLTVREYRQHQWPVQRVVLAIHVAEPAQQPLQLQLPHLPMLGQPMEKALGLLDDYCREHGFQRVASSRLGYEDEGQVLNSWREKPGQIEQLTLHCECDGDWLSLGGYGEAI